MPIPGQESRFWTRSGAGGAGAGVGPIWTTTARVRTIGLGDHSPMSRTKRAEGSATAPSPPVLPDAGYWAAPRCLSCPRRECVLLMPEEEGRTFRAALAAIRPFVRSAERAVPG
jgi:hypothetical protein